MGSRNPATLLKNQTSVDVHVVPSFGSINKEEKKPQTTDQCVIRLDDRVLVKPDSVTKTLFPTKSFEKEIWSHRIGLGGLGWGKLSAVASGNLSGNFAARYGPGVLSDICLIRRISSEDSSAPMKHPLRGPGSRADVTTFNIGGKARFSLPARITVRINGTASW